MKSLKVSTALAALAAVAAISIAPVSKAQAPADAAAVEAVDTAKFEQDRESILAMTGNYKVSFDFIETVPFVEGYELKDRKLSGGYEMVRVVEDRGDFISLQHTLVVGPPDNPVVVKHWRQDWQYEPARVLVFVGGNAWAWRDVPEAERTGAWSQTVYQVDDAPRYGAVAEWTYEDGLAAWEPPHEWRPLPRRDMTTRDDYNAVDAMNRHVITPFGWVHEQDNSKLILKGEPQVLVREVGVNTYKRSDDFAVEVGEAYWEATGDYWAGVREEWAQIEGENDAFAITIKGETEDLYNPLLELADKVQNEGKPVDEAIAEARVIIRSFVTPELGALEDRLRPTAAIETPETY